MINTPSGFQNVKESTIVIDHCQRPVLDTKYFREVISGNITAIAVTLEDLEFINGYKKAVERDLRQVLCRIAHHYRWIKSAPDLAILVENIDDLYRAKKEGKVGVIFALQNIFIDDDLEMLEILHKLGVRIIQLTYNERNLVGDGCAEPANAGLSNFGRAVIEEMNRLGIIIDLSHCSDRTTIDAIECSREPVMFTHANVRDLNLNMRNKTSEQIRKLADKGGVIGLTTYPPLTGIDDRKSPNLEDFLEQIDYVRNLVGVDHIAIGTDYDTKGTRDISLSKEITRKFSEVYSETYKTNCNNLPIKGFEKLDQFPSIISGLFAHGYSQEDVIKILGGNAIRLFSQVWKEV